VRPNEGTLTVPRRGNEKKSLRPATPVLQEPGSAGLFYTLLAPNVGKLGAESDLIDGVIPGDKLTGFGRFLRRRT